MFCYCRRCGKKSITLPPLPRKYYLQRSYTLLKFKVKYLKNQFPYNFPASHIPYLKQDTLTNTSQHPSITSRPPSHILRGCTKVSHRIIMRNLHWDKIHFSVTLWCLTVGAFQMQMRAYNIQYAPNWMQGARRSPTTQTTVLKPELRTQWQSG
jgi:hypothetical protein